MSRKYLQTLSDSLTLELNLFIGTALTALLLFIVL